MSREKASRDARSFQSSPAAPDRRDRGGMHNIRVPGGRDRPAILWVPVCRRAARLSLIDPLYGTGHGLAFQISAAYWAIVRSLENLPELATLRMALRAQASPSAYNSVSPWSASR